MVFLAWCYRLIEWGHSKESKCWHWHILIEVGKIKTHNSNGKIPMNWLNKIYKVMVQPHVSFCIPIIIIFPLFLCSLNASAADTAATFTHSVIFYLWKKCLYKNPFFSRWRYDRCPSSFLHIENERNFAHAIWWILVGKLIMYRCCAYFIRCKILDTIFHSFQRLTFSIPFRLSALYLPANSVTMRKMCVIFVKYPNRRKKRAKTK